MLTQEISVEEIRNRAFLISLGIEFERSYKVVITDLEGQKIQIFSKGWAGRISK